jgi:hypothetical protein
MNLFTAAPQSSFSNAFGSLSAEQQVAIQTVLV